MDKIRMRTNAGSINLRVTTKDDSPCELWNDGKKIAELQSDNKENIAVQNKAEEIIIKGYDIQELGCQYNQLTTLNASGCTSLQVLGCEYSPFTAEDLKKLFEDLPERKEKDGGVLLYKDGDSNYKDFTQPPELAAAFKAAKAKGWRLYKINNDDLMEL
ncbi:hypothetical protein [Treponema phagedenis]|uniref:hypothetical protein n=1 Tax=Treponema phagedenis TaxID=162 RepID=UPI0021CD1036|nr:hypothetical protein [Treponema phagedenis]